MALYEPKDPPFDMVKRADWGAVAAYPYPPQSWTPRRGGVIVHCLSQDHVAPQSHSNCFARVRDLQATDMVTPGVEALPAEPDITHSYLVCEHGIVFEGRGPLVRPFANEPVPGGNMRYYAVCALIGIADSPPDALITAMTDLNAYLGSLDGNYAAGTELLPYDATSGSPGDGLRQAISSGAIVAPDPDAHVEEESN